jgi:hypothetical protein
LSRPEGRRAYALLVGAAFSLWRAAFLSDSERRWETILDDADIVGSGLDAGFDTAPARDKWNTLHTALEVMTRRLGQRSINLLVLRLGRLGPCVRHHRLKLVCRCSLLVCRGCRVSVVDARGIRRSVDVQAERLFEAAVLSARTARGRLVRRHDWITRHTVTPAAQRWLEGGIPSPSER